MKAGLQARFLLGGPIYILTAIPEQKNFCNEDEPKKERGVGPSPLLSA